MRVAYVAGKYRDKRGFWFVKENIRLAEEASVFLWSIGIPAITPHTNTGGFDGVAPEHFWLRGYLEILRLTNLVVMLPGWGESEGAREEHRTATLLNIPIYFWPQDKDVLQRIARENEAAYQSFSEESGIGKLAKTES